MPHYLIEHMARVGGVRYVPVTMPSSLTLTSRMVPFVSTPNWVYSGFEGFFLTPRIGSWTVTFSWG